MAKVIVSFSNGSQVHFIENGGEIRLFHDEMDLIAGDKPLEARMIITAARRIYNELSIDALSIKYDSVGWFEIRIADKDDYPIFEILFHESEVNDIYDLFENGIGARRYIRSGFDKRSLDIVTRILNESLN